jgi:hypothetical protein
MEGWVGKEVAVERSNYQPNFRNTRPGRADRVSSQLDSSQQKDGRQGLIRQKTGSGVRNNSHPPELRIANGTEDKVQVSNLISSSPQPTYSS